MTFKTDNHIFFVLFFKYIEKNMNLWQSLNFTELIVQTRRRLLLNSFEENNYFSFNQNWNDLVKNLIFLIYPFWE